MKAVFDQHDSEPFLICQYHFIETYPAHVFPYCGHEERCLVRFIPAEVFTAIKQAHGLLQDPLKYKNRKGSMSSVIGTFRSYHGLGRSWICPWNPWRHYSVSATKALEDKRGAALRFNHTTCCPCKVGENLIEDALGWTVFHEFAGDEPLFNADGTLDLTPCRFHQRNVQEIDELWFELETVWEEALERFAASFREDGKDMHRDDTDPYMRLHKEFLCQAKNFSEYVKYTVKATSVNKEGQVEDCVLKAAKWEFIMQHILFAREEYYTQYMDYLRELLERYKELAVAYETIVVVPPREPVRASEDDKSHPPISSPDAVWREVIGSRNKWSRGSTADVRLSEPGREDLENPLVNPFFGRPLGFSEPAESGDDSWHE